MQSLLLCAIAQQSVIIVLLVPHQSAHPVKVQINHFHNFLYYDIIIVHYFASRVSLCVIPTIYIPIDQINITILQPQIAIYI